MRAESFFAKCLVRSLMLFAAPLAVEARASAEQPPPPTTEETDEAKAAPSDPLPPPEEKSSPLAPPPPGSAPAPAPPPDQPGAVPIDPARARAQRHLGFYLRMELGVGSMNTSATVPSASMSISGLDGAFSAAIGGAVVENLIVAGELWAASATSPEIKVNDASVKTSSDVSLNLVGIGPSVTYYLMPANVYASLTPSIARLSVRNGQSGSSGATPLGFATRLSIGKEWWVASHLGIGIAGNLHLGFNQDEVTVGTSRTEFTWTTIAGALAFSGTYN